MDAGWQVNGALGELVLDRPAALNALSLPMIRALREGLDTLAADPAVATILIRSTSDKAFCAGGDVRHVRDLALRGESAAIRTFFAEEYALNAAIAACPKPYVALIDGICMGGGVGLAVHGRYRVVTDRARLAMPETAIGFFPDVGTTYVLPRLPGATGLWMALTGASLAGEDAVAAGLATHCVLASDLPHVLAALRRAPHAVEAALAAHAAPAPPGRYAALRPEIDALFGAWSLADVDAALERSPSAFAAEARAILARRSPHSLAVTTALLAAGRHASLAHCLAAELAMTDEITRHPDFAEGIRAVLVDKDQAPRWVSPSA